MNKQSTTSLQKECLDTGRWVKYMFWLTLALVIARLVYGCWLMMTQPVELMMEKQTMTVSAADGAAWQTAAKQIYMIEFWWRSLFGVLLAVVLGYWSRCFRAINQKGSPFVAQCVRGIRATGVWIIVLGLLRGGLLQQIYKMAGFTLEQSNVLTQGEAVFTMPITGQSAFVNWHYLTIGFIIIGLAHVFAYGAYLQQEYDETL